VAHRAIVLDHYFEKMVLETSSGVAINPFVKVENEKQI
jgi:hypothetical protein